MKFVIVGICSLIIVLTILTSCGGDSAEGPKSATVEESQVEGALTHWAKGNEYVRLGRLELAIEEYSAAIRLNPQQASAYVNRAAVYSMLGQYQRALHDLDEATGLDSKDASAYVNRGGVYIVLGQYQHARKDLDEAIRLNPEHAGAYATRAVLYTYLNMDTQALADTERAIELDFSRAELERLIENAKNRR